MSEGHPVWIFTVKLRRSGDLTKCTQSLRPMYAQAELVKDAVEVAVPPVTNWKVSYSRFG